MISLVETMHLYLALIGKHTVDILTSYWGRVNRDEEVEHLQKTFDVWAAESRRHDVEMAYRHGRRYYRTDFLKKVAMEITETDKLNQERLGAIAIAVQAEAEAEEEDRRSIEESLQLQLEILDHAATYIRVKYGLTSDD